MKPLDLLADTSKIERLLRNAPPASVREELQTLASSKLSGATGVALAYAGGALALREGRLTDAFAAFDQAAEDFAVAGEAEAAALTRCEAWLAAIRRGPRKVFGNAAEALETLAAEHSDSQVVQVVAKHYCGVALRYSGQAEATLRVLLDCFSQSEGLLVERAQVLNSLGTLYVVLGAYGAAQAVLEHAADLNHQTGDFVSEAISYGQLGSAALALGEQQAAREHLQKQEWFASQVGDSFGQSRALTLLGDLAIDMGRPDDALEFGQRARSIASSVTPPLGMWVAYATRTVGRAKLELDEPDALQQLEQARSQFQKMGNQLGEALVNWDLANRLARCEPPAETPVAQTERLAPWRHAAWSLATLGLTGRVAHLLHDLRELGVAPAALPQTATHYLDLTMAATAQSYPHLSSAREVELVYSEPDTLAAIATRRIEGQRNLGRLAALSLAAPGLYVAAIASAAIGQQQRAIPTARAAAALVGLLPGVALWAWSGEREPTEIARDLSSLRAACGEDSRAALQHFPDGRLLCAPFAGEVGARVEGIGCAEIVSLAIAAEPGTLRRGSNVPWSGEAEALAVMSGYECSEE